MAKTLRVELGANSYPLHIGAAILNRTGELLKPHADIRESAYCYRHFR